LVGETIINMPKPPLKRDNEYQKRKKRKHFRKRAAIEPVIGHLKQDNRAVRNYLKGQTGDAINFMMAATGFNFRKLMKKLKTNLVWLFLKLKISILHRINCYSIINMSLIKPN
jgi:IS5 family transposase